jgi:hypothetical protein
VLAGLGWVSEESSDEPIFQVAFQLSSDPVTGFLAGIDTAEERFVLYVRVGTAVPPGRRDEVARLVTRANWGLSIGNFEFDFDDGTVRFKVSVDFGGAELSDTTVRRSILSAGDAVDFYADALNHVVSGSKTAFEAIEDAERPSA